MSTFNYAIRERSGRSTKGTVEASDLSAAAALLRERGALILKIEPVGPALGGQDKRAGARSTSRTIGGQSSRSVSKPRSSTIELGLRQISVLLRSGLTLLESLRIIAEQTTSHSMRRVMDQIASDVRTGRSFTESLRATNCFSRIVTQLSEIGEQTGQLDMVLERAAESLERRRLLKSQIISAMLYPTIVLKAAIAVTIVILVYAIPKLTVYLKALGRPLPPMTQRLVDLSQFLITEWPMILGVSLLVIILFFVAYSVPIGRLAIDSFLLRIPLIGYILRTGATAAFSRSLSILLSSGITMIEGLRTCQDLHKNRRLALAIARSREAVMAGDPLSPGFQSRGAFMPMLSSMIAAGERSGQLEQTLAECATFHEQRLSALIRMLSSVLEIVVVVAVGGIVGYVYMAFMMALYGAAL